MKEFQFTVTDELGFHARPAGVFAKLCKGFADSTISVTKGGSTVKASQLMKLMGLGVKKDDTITVTVEGGDEESVAAEVKKFLEENM